jgi:hypothetical protein
VIRDLAADSDFWLDTVWIADSRPVDCGRSRPTVKRSDMAGWANYGYCASHSRWFWGLRLFTCAHVVARILGQAEWEPVPLQNPSHGT